MFSGVSYGWDKGPNTSVASLTPQGYATTGDLIAADSWDFSGDTSGGAEGVGRACTEAFVTSFIAILMLDFFLAVLMQGIYFVFWGFKALF